MLPQQGQKDVVIGAGILWPTGCYSNSVDFHLQTGQNVTDVIQQIIVKTLFIIIYLLIDSFFKKKYSANK